MPRAAMASGSPPTATAWWPTLAASVALVLYGNLSTLAASLAWPGPLGLAAAHLLLVVGALAWARGVAGCTWDELGLGRRGWARGALLGLGLAALMAALVGGLLALFRAIDWTSRTAYPAPTDGGGVLLLGARLLLFTALCEEIWFRGVLHALWVRQLGPARGVVGVALLFAAWHLVVWARTLDRVALQPALPVVVTYPAGLLVLFVAGVLFGWQRAATGHLAGPIVAHWAIDLVLIALVVGGWL